MEPGESLKIEPTLIETTLNDQSPLMTEEIFGPLLPIVPYDNIHEALGYILSRPRPLALYLFSRNRKLQRRVVETIPFGGGCINDTISHITTPYLPFGGTGDSGMGAYHGRCGYETFTHAKSILSKPFRPGSAGALSASDRQTGPASQNTSLKEGVYHGIS